MLLHLMETEDPSWKRVWKLPRRVVRGASILGELTVQGEYLKERSYRRFIARVDVVPVEVRPEIGHLESFRMIVDDL